MASLSRPRLLGRWHRNNSGTLHMKLLILAMMRPLDLIRVLSCPCQDAQKKKTRKNKNKNKKSEVQLGLDWNRAMHKNSYQILKPAKPTYGSTYKSSSEAPATTQPTSRSKREKI
ncbi:hypothetical protein I7I50_08525 [Histoplasma capsulatum G186AR]|uniref:Uncharacterized protein n=1 Tax=Ajellomyces capsulatus TaxID=5037 RepID=A0A8H8CZR7_AJECA|nr:hypothetical protein I7I52_06040 [Histoplasma capsulatum]QSS73663.1 hypothetical protein I7I50_08525 [Histoplasma capsulatum G186AR]